MVDEGAGPHGAVEVDGRRRGWNWRICTRDVLDSHDDTARTSARCRRRERADRQKHRPSTRVVIGAA